MLVRSFADRHRKTVLRRRVKRPPFCTGGRVLKKQRVPSGNNRYNRQRNGAAGLLLMPQRTKFLRFVDAPSAGSRPQVTILWP